MIHLMKKLIAPISVALAFLASAPSAFAQLIDCAKVQPPFQGLCTTSTTDIGGIIGAALTFIFIIAIIIALFYLIFGAVRWIFSGGDKAAIESARGTIVAAIVGLVILFLVFLIFNVVLTFFNVGITTITVPTIP